MLTQPEEATTDDFLIAQMLQKQYDKEFDNALHKASTSVIYFVQVIYGKFSLV